MDIESLKNGFLVILGGLAGGFIGYWIFFWIVGQGFYGLILPGAMVGFGAGFFKSKSIIPAVACGLFALFLGLFTEWRYAPFIDNDGFIYLLTNFYQLRPITLIMIVVGTFFGFWVPFRRIGKKNPDGSNVEERPSEKN